jgi:LETM1-like protein
MEQCPGFEVPDRGAVSCAPSNLTRRFWVRAQQDDRAIRDEGLENLTEEELRAACRQRGIRAPYGEGAAAFMRRQLSEWLELSLNR